MSSLTKITFNGNIKDLLSSLQQKIPEIKLVPINNNTAIAMVDELESIHYLKGQELQQNVSIVSCEDGDYESFKIYLENKFQRGMTWKNHKRTGWHIDHIKPLSSFNLDNREEFLKACHFTNMQPLWSMDNHRKSNKII